MPDDRASHAIARIEAALRRIEAASASTMVGTAASEFSHLATRHDALRDEVRGTLRAIDALTAQGAG